MGTTCYLLIVIEDALASNGPHIKLLQELGMHFILGVKPKGKQQHFSWVTDFLLSKKNVYKIMRGGHACWKIENERFNALKNQGYHFENDFGHGYNHLGTTFAYPMTLAFLIDNIQSVSCKLFKKAQIEAIRKIRFWENSVTFFLVI